MNFLILPNSTKNSSISAINIIIDTLNSYGANCILDEEYKNSGIVNCEFYPFEKAIKISEIAITIGGDGTILHYAPYFFDKKLPIIGINLGRLGFLAEIEYDDLHKLEKLVKKEYTICKQRLLKVKTNNTTYYTLNEMVLHTSRAIKNVQLEISCDNCVVNTYRGDGVIVATTNGSTAYSLSAGGPIVDSDINCMIVTPICPHSLNAPPIIFSEDRKISVSFKDLNDINIELMIDGSYKFSFYQNDKIDISLSKRTFSFVRLNSTHQFEAVDQKLKRR